MKFEKKGKQRTAHENDLTRRRENGKELSHLSRELAMHLVAVINHKRAQFRWNNRPTALHVVERTSKRGRDDVRTA